MFRSLRNKNLFSFVAGFSAALVFVTFFRILTRDPSSGLQLSNTKRKRVMFFGDSITQHGFNTEISGWVAMFAHWWSRRVDVVNRGFSGYNSRWAKQIIDKVVTNQSPDMLFVFFGANDSVDKAVLQHVPLEEFESNLLYIVEHTKQNLPKTLIILITPPPVWEDKLQYMNSMKGKSLLTDRTNERAHLYASVVKKLGVQYKVPVVDAWTALQGETSSRADYLSDGLHLSAKGCAALFEEAKKVVLQNYPEYNPEVMDMEMPVWSQFESTKL